MVWFENSEVMVGGEESGRKQDESLQEIVRWNDGFKKNETYPYIESAPPGAAFGCGGGTSFGPIAIYLLK